MICNKNEKYLLQFISGICSDNSKHNELLEIISKFGLKPKFNNYNPVYQIIDELNYFDYIHNR